MVKKRKSLSLVESAQREECIDRALDVRSMRISTEATTLCVQLSQTSLPEDNGIEGAAVHPIRLVV